MNALLRTTIHSLWLGKYSRVLRTRRSGPLDMVCNHAFGGIHSVPPGTRPCFLHACGSTHSGVSSPSLRAFMNNPGQRHALLLRNL